MKLVVSVSVGMAMVWLASLAACSTSSDSGGAGGGGGYGTGATGGGGAGGAGGGATGGTGGGMGGSTSGGGTSGGGGSSGAGGSTACPLQIQGVSQACADCITGKCCNEFVACGQDTTCNTFNTCVVTNKPDCSAATDAAALKTCLTAPCPTTDAAFTLWSTAQACAGQSCTTECQ